jgi:hypothetical protein
MNYIWVPASSSDPADAGHHCRSARAALLSRCSDAVILLFWTLLFRCSGIAESSNISHLVLFFSLARERPFRQLARPGPLPARLAAFARPAASLR